MTPSELEGVWSIRKLLSTGDSVETTENLVKMMLKIYLRVKVYLLVYVYGYLVFIYLVL